MRFFSPISLICSWSLIDRANSVTDYCSALCEEDPQCDHTKGSYCKSWLGPQICFAYYFETADKHGPYYYHAEHDSKDTSTPMLCTDAEAIITAGTDYCRLLCPLDADCLQRGQGSYLKSWQDPQVCFGFYFANESKTSFYFWQGAGDERFPLSNADAQHFVSQLSTTTITPTTTVV